jgi:O-antigen/teichoic acid export membrane protein
MLAQIKSLTKHSAIYSIGTFIQRALGLVLLPILTDTTYLAHKSDYGDYTLVYGFIAFMQILYLYGIDSAFMRFYFLGKHVKEDTYRSAIQLLSLTAIVTSLMIFLFSEPISNVIFNDYGYQFFIKMAAAILFVDTICNLPYLILRAEERSVLYTSVRLGRFILELIFNLIFIIGLKLGVKGILYANLLAAVINLIVLFPIQFKYLHGKFSANALKDLLNFGLPLIPNGLAYLVVEMSHRYLMLYLLDKDRVGEYGANYKFGTLMLLLVTGFRTAWQPFFLKIAQQGDAKDIYARVMTYFVLGSVLVVLFGSMFIEYAVKIPVAPGKTLMGQEYWGGIFIIPVILLSYMFYGIYVNLTVGIYITKKSQLMVIFTGLAALTNIAANLYLIPEYGIIGAALATLAAYLVMMISIFIANQIIYPINYEYGRLTIIICYLILVIGLYYYFDLSIYLRVILVLGMPLILYNSKFFKSEEKIYIRNFIIRKQKGTT